MNFNISFSTELGKLKFEPQKRKSTCEIFLGMNETKATKICGKNLTVMTI